MSRESLTPLMSAACRVEQRARELAAALTDLDYEAGAWFEGNRPLWLGKWIQERRGRVNPGHWRIVDSLLDPKDL